MRFLPLLLLGAQVAGLVTYAIAPRLRPHPTPGLKAQAYALRARIAEVRSWQEDPEDPAYCDPRGALDRARACETRLKYCLDILDYGPMELP